MIDEEFLFDDESYRNHDIASITKSFRSYKESL